jgi:hypothetical protein
VPIEPSALEILFGEVPRIACPAVFALRTLTWAVPSLPVPTERLSRTMKWPSGPIRARSTGLPAVGAVLKMSGATAVGPMKLPPVAFAFPPSNHCAVAGPAAAGSAPTTAATPAADPPSNTALPIRRRETIFGDVSGSPMIALPDNSLRGRSNHSRPLAGTLLGTHCQRMP